MDDIVTTVLTCRRGCRTGMFRDSFACRRGFVNARSDEQQKLPRTPVDIQEHRLLRTTIRLPRCREMKVYVRQGGDEF